MFEEYSDVVTVRELCTMLKIGRNTAYELIHSKLIPGVMVGRQIRVRKLDIENFVSRNDFTANAIESDSIV
jgi:excisionase family DNA binding protein